MANYNTILVNPKIKGVTNDQGLPYEEKKGGNLVIASLRVLRQINSGELIEVIRKKKEEVEDGE